MKDRFIIEQKITVFVNRYAIYQAQADGTKGSLVALAQQKRLKIKEEIVFYESEAKQYMLFKFRAEKVFDIHGRYFVEDANGVQLGAFAKDFGKSIVNSTWYMLRGDERAMTISESNQAVAMMRRFAGFVPIVGDLVELAMNFIKYHFVFVDPISGQNVGMLRKTTLFRDHYVLSLDDQAYAAFDDRVWMSVGVAMDALQSR